MKPGSVVWIKGLTTMLGCLEALESDTPGYVVVSILQTDKTLARGWKAPREDVFLARGSVRSASENKHRVS